MNKWLQSAIKAPFLLFWMLPLWFFISTIGAFLWNTVLGKNPEYLHKFMELVNIITAIAFIGAILNCLYQIYKSDLSQKRKLFFASPRLFGILVLIVGWSMSLYNYELDNRRNGLFPILFWILLITTWVEARKK